MVRSIKRCYKFDPKIFSAFVKIVAIGHLVPTFTSILAPGLSVPMVIFCRQFLSLIAIK